jgi:hypothetical protein
VCKGFPVKGISVYPLERVQGKVTGGKESPENKVNQGKNLEDQQEYNYNSDDHPF